MVPDRVLRTACASACSHVCLRVRVRVRVCVRMHVLPRVMIVQEVRPAFPECHTGTRRAQEGVREDDGYGPVQQGQDLQG